MKEHDLNGKCNLQGIHDNIKIDLYLFIVYFGFGLDSSGLG